jgi:hypothetical protein
MDLSGATALDKTSVLTWTARVLTEADLRRAWQGERTVEVTRHAVVTPLARERLRECGVALTWRSDAEIKNSTAGWAVAVEGQDAKAQSVVRAFAGEGRAHVLLEGPGKETRTRWYRSLAERVGTVRGVMVFCSDAAVCICIAAKIPGVRPAVAVSAAQAARVLLTLGCNFVAIETAGRTFFELRQITRTVCDSGKPEAPPEAALVLKELDGCAHR